MAESNSAGRKPRIRKSAPTVRERQLAAAVKEDAPPSKSKRVAGAAISPIKRLRLRDRGFVKLLAKLLRPLKRVLAWLIPSYFVNSWREVRQVIWPSRRETWRLTLAVFVFAVVFGALVAGVDKVLDEIFKKVVLK